MYYIYIYICIIYIIYICVCNYISLYWQRVGTSQCEFVGEYLLDWLDLLLRLEEELSYDPSMETSFGSYGSYGSLGGSQTWSDYGHYQARNRATGQDTLGALVIL